MQTCTPQSSKAFRSRSASCPRSASSRSAFRRSPGSAAAGVVADLSGRHMEAHRATFRISDGVQICVQATFPPTDPSTAPPIFSRGLQAVRCASREVASITIVFGSTPGGQADHDPGEVPVIAPTLPTLPTPAERFDRPVFLRRIAPSPPIAADEDNAAQHTQIIVLRAAMAYR